jgi:hypothetical protein
MKDEEGKPKDDRERVAKEESESGVEKRERQETNEENAATKRAPNARSTGAAQRGMTEGDFVRPLSLTAARPGELGR